MPHRFAGGGRPIIGGKGAVQTVNDFHLSRFACYLIALNGDSRKPEIVYARRRRSALAACDMTQTRDKLAKDRVHGPQQAIRTHEQVGREVRDAIKRIGGTLPENIPPAEHIKEVEKRIKAAKPKLELDERDEGGLFGEGG